MKLEGYKSFVIIKSSYESLRSEENELKKSFVELISVFLKENCSSNQCFRPLPPKLGNGFYVDLLKLYLIVKLKGGYDSISRKNLWDEVGFLFGLGMGIGSALKLIYLKYLDSLESWLVKMDSSEGVKSERLSTEVWSKGVLGTIGLEYGKFVLKVVAEMRKSDGSYGLKGEKNGIVLIDLTGDESEDEKGDWEKFVTGFEEDGVTIEEDEDVDELKDVVELTFVDGVGSFGENHDGEKFEQMKNEMIYAGFVSSDASDDGRSSVGPVEADILVKGSENSLESKKCSNETEELVKDSSLMEVSSVKRKRDGLSAMLEWIVKVSRDPVDPVIGTIPESISCEAYGNDNCWKQVLFTREALFVKNTNQLTDQKKQKMSPSLYDDHLGSSERPRRSPKLYVNKSGMPPFSNPAKLRCPMPRMGAQIDMQPTASIYRSRPLHRIPVSIDFQADVPEWTGEVVESDLKWLGSQVWPLEKSEDDLLIQEDPIGKGRLDPCGCQFPGTTECVKFHVSRRRVNLKNELGSAYYAWNFDKMGEEFRVSWTSEEENTFMSVVKKNPFSERKCFWKRMCEALPNKPWTDQVNYYFNVFVLERRALQNRFTPIHIDSDDDETEYGLATNAHKHRAESSASASLRGWL